MHALTSAIDDRRSVFERVAEAYVSDSRIQLCQILLSLSACFLFVVETYVEGEDSTSPTWIKVLEVILTVAFAIDFSVSVFVAEDRGRYLISFSAISDVLSMVPVLTVFISAGSLSLFRILRLFKAVRILRIHRVVTYGTKQGQGDVFRRASTLVMSLFGILFLCSAVVLTMDSEDDDSFTEDMKFHDAFYFTIVTFTTIGYGDVAPETTLARLIMILFILISFFLLPYQARQLVDALSARSPYATSYKPPVRAQHIVLCGDLSAAKLNLFLMELYHEDHGQLNKLLRVVLLSPTPPAASVNHILSHPRFASKVTVLVGSPVQASDLTRACVSSAVCVFVTPPQRVEPSQADGVVVLQCISVQRYAPEARVIAQVYTASAQATLESAGVLHVLSMEDFTSRLLALSALAPGYSTLVVNLGHSLSPLAPDVLQDSHGWLAEYYNGASNELYTVKVGPTLVGLPFTVAARRLYETAGVVLVGIADRLLPQLNPARHTLSADDRVFVIASTLMSVAEAVTATHPSMSKALEDLSTFSPADASPLLTPLRDADGFFSPTASHGVQSPLRREVAPPKAPPVPLPPRVPGAPDPLRDALQALEGMAEGVHPSAYQHHRESAMLHLRAAAAVAETASSCGSRPCVAHAVVGELPAAATPGHIVVAGHMGSMRIVVDILLAYAHTQGEVMHLAVLCPNAAEVFAGVDDAAARWALPVEHTLVHVYAVHGGFTKREGLSLCAPHAARCVLFVASPGSQTSGSHDVSWGDADVVVANVELMSSLARTPTTATPHVVMEVQNGNTTRFLDTSGVLWEPPPGSEGLFLWPMFAAGSTMSAAMLLPMLCNVFYHAENLFALRALLHAGAHDEHTVQLEEVPATYVGRPVKHLFAHHSRSGAIVLGLRRPTGTRGSLAPYVMTNPPPTVTLVQGDQAFLLLPSKPKQAPPPHLPPAESKQQA